jgi:hypothetical protein
MFSEGAILKFASPQLSADSLPKKSLGYRYGVFDRTIYSAARKRRQKFLVLGENGLYGWIFGESRFFGWFFSQNLFYGWPPTS